MRHRITDPPPPQSRLSIKGLLIFILYVNDIFMSLDNETSIHTLMTPSWCARPIDDINMVTEKAQNVFKKMTTWCDANKLTINVEKTKYMVIRHPPPPPRT